MLLAIQNLIEYLNRNYINDENIENEVTTMTKTLYDPEVEKRGIEKGREEGREEGRKEGIEEGRKEEKIEIARNMKLSGLDTNTIAKITNLSEDEIDKL